MTDAAAECVAKTRCPACGSECLVRPTTVQATRWEPIRRIGYQAYCHACDVYFRTTEQGEALS